MVLCESENEPKNVIWLAQSRNVSDWREPKIDASFGRSFRGKGALDKTKEVKQGKSIGAISKLSLGLASTKGSPKMSW